MIPWAAGLLVAACGEVRNVDPVVDAPIVDASIGDVDRPIDAPIDAPVDEPDPDAPAGMERTVVHAEVPEIELTRYAVTLRSLTAGSGRFTRAFARHELVPSAVAATMRKPEE